MGYASTGNPTVVLVRTLTTMILGALVAILFTACSREPILPSNLLLTSGDFPGESIMEVAKTPSATNKNEPAAHIELRAPGFTVQESLVLFQTRELAREILSGIKQDLAVLGVISTAVEGFEDNSGVMIKLLDEEKTSTVFFVEGRAMVRITVNDETQTANIWEIARLAREKSKS